MVGFLHVRGSIGSHSSKNQQADEMKQMTGDRGGRARSLLCGQRAYKLFRFAGRWNAALLIFVIIALLAYESTASIWTARLSFQIVGGVLGSVGSLAGLIILFGTLTYLLKCDRSSSRLLWLAVFLVGASFGSSLYFFVVYRKQVSNV
jgi:hypothetical protein